jgi:putative transposase
MRGVRTLERTEAFVSNYGPIPQHFVPKRHLIRTSFNSKQTATRFETWRLVMGFAGGTSAAFERHATPAFLRLACTYVIMPT